jgi:hypothetical protein
LPVTPELLTAVDHPAPTIVSVQRISSGEWGSTASGLLDGPFSHPEPREGTEDFQSCAQF